MSYCVWPDRSDKTEWGLRLTRVDPCPIILDCGQPRFSYGQAGSWERGYFSAHLWNFRQFQFPQILRLFNTISQGNSINSVIFAFIARGGGGNLQFQTLVNSHNTQHCFGEDLLWSSLKNDHILIRSLSKRFPLEVWGQRRNKLCFRWWWEKLTKLSLIHPIQLDCVVFRRMHWNSFLFTKFKIQNTEHKKYSIQRRRVVLFSCVISPQYGGSTVDPSVRQAELENGFKNVLLLPG